MIANSDMFLAIILSKNVTDVTCKLIIYDNKIETAKSVKLPEVKIDYQIKFYEHMSTSSSKAAIQLSALYRLQKYMGKTEKNAIINNSIYSNFNYCPLVWHFCSF